MRRVEGGGESKGRVVEELFSGRDQQEERVTLKPVAEEADKYR